MDSSGKALAKCSLDRSEDSEGVSHVDIKEKTMLAEEISANALKGK